MWGATSCPAPSRWQPANFNPRSPCGERPGRPARLRRSQRFQSTLPVWGATGSRGKGDDLPKDFNPRSPCGERQLFCREYRGDLRFQSTLPVWGATGGLPTAARRREFQSTLPVWGATNVQVSVLGPGLISIHAPRVGSDGILTGVDDGKGGFQSTLPVWGATLVLELQERRGEISIHAPRVGSDLVSPAKMSRSSDFNPRSPCGERRPRRPWGPWK